MTLEEQPSTSSQVAELQQWARTAARLSESLEELAQMLDKVGRIGAPSARNAAAQLRAMDIPAVLTLPPEQVTLLLRTLRELTEALKRELVSYLSDPSPDAP
jgi:hypothetical protein